MLSGLKIKFKNANEDITVDKDTLQQTNTISFEEKDINSDSKNEINSKKWKNEKTDSVTNTDNKPKLEKRKYDFGKASSPIKDTKSTKIDERTTREEKGQVKIDKINDQKKIEKSLVEEKQPIETLDQLRSEVDDIWDNIKKGELDQAGDQLFQLDSNINRWLYNLKDTTESFSTFGATNNTNSENEAARFDFSKHGKGFLDSQKAEIEKYEDGDYKTFLKKMEEKKVKKETRILSSCRYCLENGKLKEYEVLTLNSHFYLLQPGKTSFPGKHLILVPVDHITSSIHIKPNDEAYSVLQKMKNQIVEFYKKEYNCSTLIYETAMNFEKVPHCKIEFFAYDSEFENQMPLFFEIGFRDLGSEWSTHKKAIKVLRSKGGLVKQIPDKFEYAYVEFDCSEQKNGYSEQQDWIGLAHIIEDPEKFNRQFFYEVMGSALELDVMVAKAPKELDQNQLVDFKAWFRSRFNQQVKEDE